MKITRMKVKTQVLLLVLIVSIVAYIFLIQRGRSWSNSYYNSITDSKLSTAITVSREFIGTDFHDKITDKNSVTPEEYNRIATTFQHICHDLGLKYIWSALKINDTIVFTTATPNITKNKQRLIPYFFEAVPQQKLYNEVISSGHKSQKRFDSRWGEIEATMIPYTDSRGYSYVFCAALDDMKYRHEIASLFRQHLIYGSILILSLMILAYLFISFLVRPLTLITSNIQKVATGEFNYKKSNWASEYLALANSISIMYSEIKDNYSTIQMQEKDLKTTLMCIGDGVIVTDKEGKITRINKEAIKLTGWNKTESKGIKVETIFRIYDSQNSNYDATPLQTVLSTGKTKVLERNIMLISKTGSECHISGIIAPIITDERVTGAVISFKNLTPEDQQAEKIRQNHEIMLDILRLSKIAYWEYNVKADNFWVSREFVNIFGIDEIEEGIIDSDTLLKKYFDNNTNCNTLNEINEAVTQKQSFRSAHEVLNINTGQPLFFDAAAIPILDPEGNIEKLIGLTKDITEYKTLTHQLYHSQKLDAVGQLAGGVAHDFNNMLGGIIGFAELLMNNIKGDDKLLSYCNSIINTGENAAKLTSQLLSFARKGQNISTPMSVHKTIDSAIALLNRSFDKKINISKQLGATVDTIIGDPSQIESVIINMGINSRDALGINGTILITTELTELSPSFCKISTFKIDPGSYIIIKIIDNGSGMDGETMNHIFEPFFTTKDEGKGTGLGLSVIHSIITAHKGMINAYSELGKGTEFKIYLPLCEKVHINDISNSKTSENYFGNEGILLVDDEEIIRNMGTALLEDLGYTVYTAENGARALEIYKENRKKIALVVLDVVMPIMGGMECLKKLKTLNPDIKVIIASGFSRSDTSSDFKKNGAADFIDKPYRQITLAEAIKKALQSHS